MAARPHNSYPEHNVIELPKKMHIDVANALEFQRRIFEYQKKLPFYYKVKIIMETFWTLVLLGILGIPMLSIALVVWARMGHPIIFKQIRVGKNGRPFWAYKFRTMRNGSPGVIDLGFAPLQKVGNDSRVIGRLGSFLRKYKWDELPQFFNVLKGDMCLIGPRPYIYEENFIMNGESVVHFSVRPGISGLWQTCYRGEINPEKKIAMDVKYVEKMSFSMDRKIFLATLKVTFVKGEKKT